MSALVLSALVGIVMPLGDTAIASANAGERTQVTPGVVDPSTAQPPATGSPDATAPAPGDSAATPGGDGAAPDDNVPGGSAPDGSAPDESAPDSALPDGSAPDDATGDAQRDAAPRAQAAPLATPGAYGFTWSVSDAAGRPTEGAEFHLEGPASTSGWTNQVIWNASYRVTDCTSGPCAPDSMDQDPRPGVFQVDRLVADGRVTALTAAVRGQRFRLKTADAPQGHKWSAGAAERQVTGLGATPVPSPWAANQWNFGSFAVAPSPIECRPGYVYSVQENGQLQRAIVDGDRATITNVGSPAGGFFGGRFNGLGIGSTGTDIYAFDRNNGHAVHRFDTGSESWASTGATVAVDAATYSLIAGAVAPNGEYWVGGFSAATKNWWGGLNEDGGTYFQLWSMERGSNQMKPRGKVDLRGLTVGTSSGVNGDLAFDTLGNLYIVRGLNSTLQVMRLDANRLSGGRDYAGIAGAERVAEFSNPTFVNTNGIAYDSSGKLYVGTNTSLAFLSQNAAGNWQTSGALRVPLGFATTDLATCSYPPTVKLQKELPDGRAFAGDQFELELKVGQGSSLGKKTTTGTALGTQPDSVGPVPVGIGTTVSLSEVAAPGSTANLANYTATWECSVDGTRIPGGTGTGTSGQFQVPASAAGKQVLCTIRNTLMKVTKEANPKSGTATTGDQVVTYTLRFDNSTGAAAANVNYRDFLADVLDDATFYDPNTGKRSTTPVVTSSHPSLTSSWGAKGAWLDAGGSVPARQVGTLTFPVKVLPNAQDSAGRQNLTGTEGFFLRNKLARGASETPPSSCEAGLCTEHLINAWSLEKTSKPASGARLHRGGNVHYSVTATKSNAGTTLNGLVLQDDLTHVFKSAGWAPGAAVPGGAKARGVYLFDRAGFTLGLDGRQNTGDKSKLLAVQSVPEPTQRNVAAPGAPADMRWIVTSGAPLNLPKEAVRAEMWFAVVAAESPVGIPDPSVWDGQGNAPVSGWQFANYATGIATKQPGAPVGDFAPNECVTGIDVPNTSAAPTAAKPIDLSFPAACRTQHEVSQNYFTIRKDAGGAGVQHLADDEAWDPDPTGLWNMVGHEFEIRDTDRATGKATAYPSAKLCRTDYSPEVGWDGTWAGPAAAADASRWAFGAKGLAIQKKILERNNAFPDAKPLPMCGTISEIADGNQAGRWRSENLEAGDYWLVETRAPNAQSAENATSRAPRPVAGVQRLAQPVPFKIWPEAEGPTSGESSMRGRGQLDVGNGSGGYLDRCNAGQRDPATGKFLTGGTVAERPTACVNPTGYLMLVKDPAPAPLPLTGGTGPWLLWGGGGIALLIASAGIIWWRMRRPVVSRHAA